MLQDGKLILSDGEESGPEQLDSDFEGARESLSKQFSSETPLKAGYLRKKAEHRKVVYI